MKFIGSKYLIITTVAVLVLQGLAGCTDSSSDEEGGSSATKPGVSQPTVVGALSLTLNSQYPTRSFYTGRVEAARSSDLGFELGGLLKSVAFDEGDNIKAGSVLATLDTDRLDAQRQEAYAGVAQAEAQALLAKSTLDRMVEAREFDGVSLQQFDEAGNAAQTAEAAVMAARSRLRRVKVDVEKAQLIAPYNAVVLKRHFDEGQVLGPGQAVMSVQEADNLQVRIGVVGDAVTQLERDGQYTLIVNERPVLATLRSVLPARDAVTRTVDAIFMLSAEQASTIKVGDLAQLELRRNVQINGYWVPLTALAEGERGLWSTYVLVRKSQQEKNSTHVIESRAVQVLYQDGSRAYINGAVKPDEQVVPSGLNRVVPGQQVTLAPEGS